MVFLSEYAKETYLGIDRFDRTQKTPISAMEGAAMLHFSVDKISCGGCVGRAERAILGVDGVAQATVNLATKQARVDSPITLASSIFDALENAGYPAKTDRITLKIDNMTCAACSTRIERALADITGVRKATVNLAHSSAQVTFVEGLVSIPELVKTVTQLGYGAALVSTDSPHDRPDDTGFRFFLALIFTLPVFIAEMGGHALPAMHHWLMSVYGAFGLGLIEFLLITLVMVWPGRAFYTIGLRALFKGAPEMNSLVSIGTLAAWSYSSIVVFAPALLPETAHNLYFEASGVIITLILLGRWLEARAKTRAARSIQDLVELAPKTAMLWNNGTPKEVAIAELHIDDEILARTGDRIAVDGIITDGSCQIDESAITGEPFGAPKTIGDKVVGGTITLDGSFRYRATHVGNSTMLAQIIDMVQSAQGAKLPIQSLVDRIVRYFVPVILGLAVLTLIAWLVFAPALGIDYALIAMVSVLIIACPCALGLAVPMSVMVASGRAAKMGIFIQQGDALQKMRDVTTVAFDKTGTLTEGTPTVASVTWAPEVEQSRTLGLIYAVEQQSNHPLAHAICDHIGAQTEMSVENLKTTAGKGVRANVEGQDVIIGSPDFLDNLSIDIAHFAEARQGAHSLVICAIDGVAQVAFALADELRDGARETIAALKNLGIKTVMISGDAQNAAKDVGTRLGIDEVFAPTLPKDKAKIVSQLQNVGPVAFVGDGINDAPALAQADVGIAMGSGTAIAAETADLVLANGTPQAVLTFRSLSKATMRNMHQNLFWAFGYNVILIPLAAGALYPMWGVLLSPALAAGAMALSSLFVVTNALRLRTKS